MHGIHAAGRGRSSLTTPEAVLASQSSRGTRPDPKLAPPHHAPWRFGLGSSTSWSSALGGGLNWDIASFVAIRIFQIDSVHTHLASASQNQPRVSAGIVFPFEFGLSWRCPFCRGDASARPKGRNYFRSEEHTSELQSRGHLVCRLLLEKKITNNYIHH